MLLALDTATDTASLAIYDLAARHLLAELTWQARRRQTQDLLSTAQQLLAQLNLTPQDLTALAVTTGPGSFTGVRIAISTVKGIGLGLPTPPKVIGIPTLCVTAAPWLRLAGRHSAPVTVCAFIQAGRGRYNWTMFAPDDLLRRPAAAEHQGGNAEEFTQVLAQMAPLGLVQSTVWLVGEWDANLEEVVRSWAHVTMIDPISGLRRAGQLARLAMLHLAHGAEDELQTIQPLYLRNP
jgi:tRNA threonylcarbamoyladenosine biosynthesis protein TsaB